MTADKFADLSIAIEGERAMSLAKLRKAHEGWLPTFMS